MRLVMRLRSLTLSASLNRQLRPYETISSSTPGRKIRFSTSERMLSSVIVTYLLASNTCPNSPRRYRDTFERVSFSGFSVAEKNSLIMA